jgi:hypothetical protein
MSEAMRAFLERELDAAEKVIDRLEGEAQAGRDLRQKINELREPSGPYSMDRLTHAHNVISHMQQVAIDATDAFDAATETKA